MDKNAIKKYAVWARRELISRVSQRAAWYGITEKDPIDEQLQAVHGHVFTPTELTQRKALIEHIRKQGYQQVMEEVAYTWFNRFIALRFMEVNGYLPSYVRVFSDENNAFNPQILAEALHVELAGMEKEKVYAFEEKNDKEGLFKYLIISQCNDLYRMLPGMFQRLSDYTELLFPENLLREGSVIEQMVTAIPEDDWKDAVQIIGWLYQYYNAEPKDEVFAALKKNVKISKEKIPAATQLFTPDWIVRYMVENSLGRLWVEGHPNEEIKKNWKYYLEEAQQEPEVEKQLAEIRAEYAKIDPASILCTDPCMGSGHILVYMFDVLMQVYLSYGYTTNEAVESIVRNNLWGMDIDDRAAQLAYFAVMMKARQYDKRWLVKQVNKPVQPNVFALQDSGEWEAFEPRMRQAFVHHPSVFEDVAVRTAKLLFETFVDAKEYGSIIQPEIQMEDLDILEKVLGDMGGQADLMDMAAQADAAELMETLKPLIRQCRGLVQKYHAVVTNPPYMGSSNVNKYLLKFIDTHYADYRSDLSTVFMERSRLLCGQHGLFAMINIPVWMFISRFEKLRERFSVNSTYVNMLHLGRGVFGSDFGTVAFCFVNGHVKNYSGTYLRLFNEQGSVSSLEEKEMWFYENDRKYYINQDLFRKITGAPVAYSLSEKIFETFNNPTVETVSESKAGVATSDNDKYLRLWYEIDYSRVDLSATSISDFHSRGKRYAIYNKGGPYRKWYGNLDYLIKFDKNSYEELLTIGNKLPSRNYYFKKAITWSDISMRGVAFRYESEGSIFDGSADVVFTDECYFFYLLGLLNTNYVSELSVVLNPTIHFKLGDYRKIPFIYDTGLAEEIKTIVAECVSISKEDWDEQETSWDFQSSALVQYKENGYLQDIFSERKQYVTDRFIKLKKNEERLNMLFSSIYKLDETVPSRVMDKDVTIKQPNRVEEIKNLISYAVGCILGRYSLDKPGLVFAGGEWDSSQYKKYPVDIDGILPISDDEYFEDDIVGMFVNWLRTVFGEDSLEANLKFVADSLGGKGVPRDVLRQYFLNDFYKDHLKTYQAHPIYWLFDSGKKNGFKCLIYMHRYQPDTIARIRTDYVHETQARYRNAIETLERQSANASAGEKVKLGKQLEALRAQAEEVRVYEEKIHHLADQMIPIDLDDGVKVNYAKFADVLAPIK